MTHLYQSEACDGPVNLQFKVTDHQSDPLLCFLNPLTPDLNAPAQQRPAEVFKYGFLFLTLTLRKKIISHTLLHQI
jgi:hypothetical protein